MATSKPEPPLNFPEPSRERLDSWKEIAAYLRRDERTVRRWEKEGLPVRRKVHKKQASVFAYRAEIDAWWHDGRQRLEQKEQAGSRKRSFRWVAALTMVLAVTTIVLLRLRRTPPLTERDSVLLSDLDNKTGDPAFEGTLQHVLTIKLRESPFLNIMSRQRVQEALRSLGKPKDEHLTPAIAKEVCQREGARAILTSSIAISGKSYGITLEATDCRNGAQLAREQARADGKDEVLRALSKAATDLRGKLGESLNTKFDVPVEEATTSSLAALKAFSIGEERRARGEQAEAVPYFESAIELDSKFASAYVNLGAIYRNLGELNRAVQYQEKAFELRDRVSEPERLYITAHYYQDVAGDVGKAVATYEVWAKTYPRDWSPHNNLAVMYTEIGQPDKAVEEAQEAVRLNPKTALAYNNLGSAYLRLNRFQEAKFTYEQALAQKLDYMSIHRGLYWIAFVLNDVEGMDRETKQAKGNSEEYRLLTDEALVAASRGQLESSRELTGRAVLGAERAGLKGTAVWIVERQALTEAVIGNIKRARAFAIQGVGMVRSQDALSGGALALALSGDASEAQRLMFELRSRFPNDTWIQNALLPTARAAVAISHNDPNRALEILQQVAPYEFGLRSGFLPTYLSGLAYLSASRSKEAAAEFQRILDHRGADPVSPLYFLSYLQIARAYALAGDPDASRKAYQSFLNAWTNADSGISLLRQSRDEMARLK